MDLKSIFILPVLLLTACSGGDYVAKVGEKNISQAEFEAHLNFKRIQADQGERVQLELERLLEQSALAQAIEAEELFDTDALQAELNEFKNQMVYSRYMSKYLDLAVTDAAVENYYNSHQDDYTNQLTHLAHIVFRVHSSMSDAERQVAQQKARDVVAKLAKGESFDALAEEYSEDKSSAANGGNLGWLDAESIDPDFAKAIAELEEGQTSGVVSTRYGYHVIKVLDPVKKKLSPLKQVEGDIRYLLRQKAKEAETQRLLGSVEIKTLK